MSLPQQFHAAQHQGMTFRNGDRIWNENTVFMRIGEQSIKGYYRSGKRLLRGLPKTYESYELHYDGADLTVGDFKALFTWKDAKKLSVFDRNTNDFAQKFALKINQMSAMESLEEFSVILYSHSYESININDFLTKLPALKKARFLFSSKIDDDDKIVFINKLKLPKGWKSSLETIVVQRRDKGADYFGTYKTLECVYTGKKKNTNTNA